MDLHHVRYFLAIIDHESINAAAAAVGVSQPTISEALRSFERELGTPLFHRIGRGMMPTSAGHALVGAARKILRDTAIAGGAVPDSDGQLRGHVDIRSNPAVSTGALPVVLAAFRLRHPRVRITIGTLEDEPVGPLLRDAVCEMVVTHLPFVPSWDAGEHDSGLEVVELGSQEYWVAYPPDAQVPPEDPMSWEQLDTPMIVVPTRGPLAAEIVRMLSPTQQVRPAAVTLQNREARLAFALAGVGATWIERSMAPMARARGAQVRALEPALKAPFGLVFERDALSPTAAAFVEIARGYSTGGLTPVAVDSATASKAAAAGDS